MVVASYNTFDGKNFDVDSITGLSDDKRVQFYIDSGKPRA
jgi:hypothetical protein